MDTHTQAFMDRLLEQGIKSQAEVIAPILLSRDVAVVVFEPGELARKALGKLGWDGRSAAFRLSRRGLVTMASCTDDVTRRWLRSKRPGRILVVSGQGSLLVNYKPGDGYSLEPGSALVH